MTNRQKKIFISIYIAVVIALLILTGSIFSRFDHEPQDGSERLPREEREDTEESETEAKLSAEETLRALAEILYTYDTRERMFYEGAERYMTDKAYEQLVPLQDTEEEDLPVRQMVSRLKEITCYFRPAAEGKTRRSRCWTRSRGCSAAGTAAGAAGGFFAGILWRLCGILSMGTPSGCMPSGWGRGPWAA